MIKRLFFFCILLHGLQASGQTMNLEWVRQISGNNYDTGTRLKITPDGSVLAVGYFNGTTDFDPGPGVYPLSTVGALDIYICKYDSSGHLLWARSMGGTQHDQAADLALDDAGNIYIAGNFESDSIDMDPGPAVHYLYQGSTPSANGFMMKLDPMGNFLWAFKISSTYYSTYTSLVVEGNSIYGLGYFTDTTDLNPGPATTQFIAQGINHYSDVFFAKYSTGGAFQWCRRIGGVASDASATMRYWQGTLLLNGEFGDTVDFDPGPGTFYKYASGVYDAFLCRTDTSGNFIWVKSMGGNMSVFSGDLEIDSIGSIYATATLQGTADFGVGTAACIFSTASTAVLSTVLVKLNAAGDFVFGRQWGSPTTSLTGGIMDLDDYADIYIGLGYEASADADPGAGTYTLDIDGNADANSFICRLDSSGNFVEAKRFTNTLGYNAIYDIAIGPDQSVYSTGEFRNTTDFDPDFFSYSLTCTAVTDAYIHKMKTIHYSTVGLEPAAQHDVLVYPNPASEYIIVRAEEIPGSRLVIYNEQGKEVSSAIWLPGANQLYMPVSALVPGLYILTLTGENGSCFTHKFIKE